MARTVLMLSIEEYSNMMEMLEDYFDSLRAKELEENPEKGGFDKKYKRRGTSTY